MRKTNRLATCLIALVFVVLALLPLTQEPLRFDMQLAAGKPLLGHTLREFGIKQGNLPFQQAFLVEGLWVVVAIILVLLALALPVFIQARKRASRVRYGGIVRRQVLPQATPPRAF
jgi:hypothetical protein